MTWWEGRMVAFDLETTAADPEEARIVTAAVALCGGGQPTETKTWLADPGVEIPEEAAAVHGITTEHARAEGRPAEEVVREVVTHLAVELARSGGPLVIFNARYDLTVADRECRRYGVPLLQDRHFNLLVVDPLVIDKWLDRYRKGSRKLEAICGHYGATLDDAHDASFDALAAARLAWCVGAKGQVVRQVWNAEMGREKAALVSEWERVRGDLFHLHAAQRRWAHEQAVGLAEHFRSKGEDASGVRTEWPLIPAGG